MEACDHNTLTGGFGHVIVEIDAAEDDVRILIAPRIDKGFSVMKASRQMVRGVFLHHGPDLRSRHGQHQQIVGKAIQHVHIAHRDIAGMHHVTAGGGHRSH